MNKLKTAVTLLLMLVAVNCFAAAIQNLRDIPVPVNLDGSYPAIEEVQRAIIAGCRNRGWTLVLLEQGRIKATISVRSKHFAEIEIAYTAESYSILYKSSDNLDYNEARQRIHRNYNRWVVMLQRSIQREFGVSSQGY